MSYKRKELYFSLTLPLVAFFICMSFYFLFNNLLLFTVYIILFFLTCLFQSYCCTYQGCPYIGGFCPAVAEIYPSNLLAKLLLKRGIKKSKEAFTVCASGAFISLVMFILFPLYWMLTVHAVWGILYLLYLFLYFPFFFLSICPFCAIKRTCPGGQVHAIFRNRKI